MHLLFIPPFSREWLFLECGDKYTQSDLILILSDSKSEIISTFNLVWDKLKWEWPTDHSNQWWIVNCVSVCVSLCGLVCLCMNMCVFALTRLSVCVSVSLRVCDCIMYMSVCVCMALCNSASQQFLLSQPGWRNDDWLEPGSYCHLHHHHQYYNHHQL